MSVPYKIKLLLALSCVSLLASACTSRNRTIDSSIDETGGSLRVSEGDAAGAQIVVPPGAVDVATRFSIRTGAALETLPVDTRPLGPVVTFGPEGSLFATAVTISLPASEEPMVLLTRSGAGEPWTRVEGAVWDPASRLVTANVLHFSDFVPVGRSGGSDGGVADVPPDLDVPTTDAGGRDTGDFCRTHPRDPACVTVDPPLPGCDAISQDCAAGQMCVGSEHESGYDFGDGRRALCIPAGTGVPGASCGVRSDCSPGTQCVFATMRDESLIWFSQDEEEFIHHPSACLTICDHAAPSCDTGEICHPVQLAGFSGRDVNETYGVCAPPPGPTPPRT